MTRRMKILSVSALALTIGAAAYYIPQLDRMAQIGVGYKTKVLCSEVLVAGREYDDVLNTNFFGIDPLLEYVNLDVDREKNIVSGSLWGLGSSKAVYRDGLGCTIDIGEGVSTVEISPSATGQQNTQEYEITYRPEIQTAIDALFDDDKLTHPIKTRGVVVIQDGKIVGEKYTEGFGPATRQQSWSMSKGVTQALVGILAKKELLSLDDTNLMTDWKADDPRSKIKLGDLLHMASGLEFFEEYGDTESDAVQMLFNSADMASYAAQKSLVGTPGEKAIYSSGTTNIVSSIIRDRLENAGTSYHNFPHEELFAKLGMDSAIFEVDAAGTFIGSSYIYATPRDYARFGQLYLQNGNWDGEQILPENWVKYTGSPAPQSGGKYGSHWSINKDGSSLPGMPEDVIYLGGNDGQFIFVIPSKNAVIVRLGIMREPATFEDDLYPLIRDLFEAI